MPRELRRANVQIRQVPEALVQVEAVAHEQLVGHGEADVADRQVVDETPVRPVEQRHDADGGGTAQPQSPAQVTHRQTRVHDVNGDKHVAASDVAVEILDETHAALTAMEGLELDEVQLVRERKGARQVGGEDEAPAQRNDENKVAPVVVAGDVGSELARARG